jgi:hypothetical protein
MPPPARSVGLDHRIGQVHAALERAGLGELFPDG